MSYMGMLLWKAQFVVKKFPFISWNVKYQKSQGVINVVFQNIQPRQYKQDFIFQSIMLSFFVFYLTEKKAEQNLSKTISSLSKFFPFISQ